MIKNVNSVIDRRRSLDTPVRRRKRYHRMLSENKMSSSAIFINNEKCVLLLLLLVFLIKMLCIISYNIIILLILNDERNFIYVRLFSIILGSYWSRQDKLKITSKSVSRYQSSVRAAT